MGEVFLATDTRLGRQVAIKRIRRPSGADSADPVGMQRLRREAQAAAIVHHPNVVTIHDLVDDGENLYVVMEYVKGQTLAALTRARSTVDPLTVGRIGAQIAGALEAAHRVGVIHRDVKPANILVDGDGTAKLADFGIARSVGDDPLTGTGLFIGSLLFMAPEVAGGGPRPQRRTCTPSARPCSRPVRAMPRSRSRLHRQRNCWPGCSGSPPRRRATPGHSPA